MLLSLHSWYAGSFLVFFYRSYFVDIIDANMLVNTLIQVGIPVIFISTSEFTKNTLYLLACQENAFG